MKSLGKYKYYCLPDVIGHKSRLPISIRILLESLLRNCDGKKVQQKDIENLIHWNAKKPNQTDVPFCVSRVILQDFTGVPLLTDLAAMRDAVKDPSIIEPQVPVDLVIDHSVQVDRAGTKDAFLCNLELEFKRNKERYEFLKWGQQTFKTFKVVPPGIGIVHQVNLEHLATVVAEKDGVLFFDTLVGTDSHTTMINGLAIVGWGVGGIEAEAAMLGQPVCIATPEVIGVHLTGKLQEGITATDLTLKITELLRKENVVEKFVEFFGPGTETLSVQDRATIANMAPEYGATMGFFPADEKTLQYLKMTGREDSHVQMVAQYLKAQEVFGIPKLGEIDYTRVIELNLNTLMPCISGPKRPQDRINLSEAKSKFQSLFSATVDSGGYGKTKQDLKKVILLHAEGYFPTEKVLDSGGTTKEDKEKAIWSEDEMLLNRPFTNPSSNISCTQPIKIDGILSHGSIVIAAITSCTNTSNPSVMIGAGLLAKKAVEKGLKINPIVKTSFAPGSRVVTDYLEKTNLQPFLDQLGFQLVAYGCTTCIGNSGPLEPKIEKQIKEFDLITCSVLSGNRNFEARIHSSVKANFLMSPALVIAYALAGNINIDLTEEPIGKDLNENPVFLKDIWPSNEEIEKTIQQSIRPEMFKKRYAKILTDNPVWQTIKVKDSQRYAWDPKSTYIRKPPFFETKYEKPTFHNMRALALFQDSVTTDHISPAGAFSRECPAGQYLQSHNIAPDDFNSYGSRRGNYEVMVRGTFANVRLKNKMADGKEGGFTKLMPEGKLTTIFDASKHYLQNKIPLIIFAGKDYGMGSSRDWAAKGTALLGVKAVVAESFERIHRSNLIGMGVLPLLFTNKQNIQSLNIKGSESFSLHGLDGKILPRQKVILSFENHKIELIAALETPIEVEYFEHGGILPYTLSGCER